MAYRNCAECKTDLATRGINPSQPLYMGPGQYLPSYCERYCHQLDTVLRGDSERTEQASTSKVGTLDGQRIDKIVYHHVTETHKPNERELAAKRVRQHKEQYQGIKE